MDTDRLAAALADVLHPVLGAVTVENLTTLTGGASRTTWAFDAVDAGGRRGLILRTGPPDDVHAGMELEAAVQQRAAAAGAPVPHILAADNGAAALGNPYLICEAIAGETIVRRIHRGLDDAGRERLLAQCAEALAAVHRADPHGIGLREADPLDQWRAQLDEMDDTTATFEWAFRWLATHRPPSSPTVLVHGDFRMGNLIVDGSRLAAVLDWELAHVGERYEDLAWFCIRAWRFGAPARLGAGGLGSVESFLSSLRGRRRAEPGPCDVPLVVDGRDAALGRHLPLPGPAAPVRSDAVGRAGRNRAAGVRDGIRSTGSAGRRWSAVTPESPAPSAWLYGRPTAAELVAAAADFLDTDVRGACGGQVNFHARVAANALRIVERELRDDAAAEVAEALARVGVTDEPALSGAVRAGDFDDRATELMAVLRALVGHRLAVNHPGYALVGDQDPPQPARTDVRSRDDHR